MPSVFWVGIVLSIISSCPIITSQPCLILTVAVRALPWTVYLAFHSRIQRPPLHIWVTCNSSESLWTALSNASCRSLLPAVWLLPCHPGQPSVITCFHLIPSALWAAPELSLSPFGLLPRKKYFYSTCFLCCFCAKCFLQYFATFFCRELNFLFSKVLSQSYRLF